MSRSWKLNGYPWLKFQATSKVSCVQESRGLPTLSPIVMRNHWKITEHFQGNYIIFFRLHFQRFELPFFASGKPTARALWRTVSCLPWPHWCFEKQKTVVGQGQLHGNLATNNVDSRFREDPHWCHLSENNVILPNTSLKETSSAVRFSGKTTNSFLLHMLK